MSINEAEVKEVAKTFNYLNCETSYEHYVFADEEGSPAPHHDYKEDCGNPYCSFCSEANLDSLADEAEAATQRWAEERGF